MEYQDRLYSQFLYKSSNNISYKKIEKVISDTGISRNVFTSDLSGLSISERISELNRVIASERSRLYYPGDPEYLLNVYRLGEQEYFLILSVCGSFLSNQSKTINHICLNLFNCMPESCSSLISPTNSSRKAALNYWSDLFLNLNPDKLKGIHRSTSKLYMMSFSADFDIEVAFDEYIEQGGSGSALCATVFGQLTSHMLNSPQVILNQILTGTPLSSAPIILNNATRFKQSLQEVKSQFQNISTNCFCSRNELYHAIGNRFINRVMISSGYADSQMYTRLLERMQPEVCYFQPAIDTLNSPLCVFTHRFDGHMTLIYYYDSVAFESVNMQKFHETVCGLFRRALNIKDDTIGNINAETLTTPQKESTGNSISKDEMLHIKALKRLNIFKDYDDVELFSLLDNVSFTLKNSKQYILAPEGMVDSVYFILSGKVSVMGRNSEGFINPLFIEKAGDIFGIEALTQDSHLKNIYQAYSDDVILLTIKKDALINEIKKHPEIMQYILEQQIDISSRFQKLWLTV